MLKILASLFFILISSSAFAESQRNPCYTTGAQSTNGIENCIGVGTGTPLPVTSTPSSNSGIAAISPSSALASSWNAGTAKNLYGFQVNTTTVSGWVLIFDATSLPSNGSVTPIKWYQVSSSQTLAVSWNDIPLNTSNGIVIGFSTTGPFTLTASVTATFSGEAK